MASKARLQKEVHPITIRWNNGGDRVYFAYDGDGWSNKYEMQRSEKEFVLIINLSPGIYRYKFIVNNQWTFNQCDKWMNDMDGNPYNVLYVESYQTQQTRLKERQNILKNQSDQKYSFGQNIPNYQQYQHEDPPKCPLHLYSNKWNNGNDDQKEDNYKNMRMKVPSHVKLNHLYILNKKNKDVLVMKLTEKFKDKYVDTIYYKATESESPFA